MNCPSCRNAETSVKKTTDVGSYIVRRRACGCGATWITEETVVRSTIKTIAAEKASAGYGKATNAPPIAITNPPVSTNGAGGVGGALSSDRIPDPEIDPDPSSQSATDPSGIWSGYQWLKRFGQAHAPRWGTQHYGNTTDAQASAKLSDLLDQTPPAVRLATQTRAEEMFAAYWTNDEKDVVRARHPFNFFVTRFGGLRDRFLGKPCGAAARRYPTLSRPGDEKKSA